MDTHPLDRRLLRLAPLALAAGLALTACGGSEDSASSETSSAASSAASDPASAGGDASAAADGAATGADGTGGDAAADAEGAGPGVSDGGVPESVGPDENAADAIPAGEYTVVPGDTLGQISQRAGITVQDIAQASDVTSIHDLEVGQVLTIPEP